MARFLHTADWQLGMARHYLDRDAQARFSAARLDVIDRMARLAIDEQCEFAVVCGDVFESNQVQRQVLVRAFEKLAALSSAQLLPTARQPRPAGCIDDLQFFDLHRALPEKCQGPRMGSSQCKQCQESSWCPPLGPTSTQLPIWWMPPAVGLRKPNPCAVVVGHGAIDSMSPDPNDPKVIALERLEERIQAGLIQYVALGDRHSTTGVGTSGRVYYSGAPEPTDYDEIDPGNVLIVDLGTDNVDVIVKRVGTWRFRRRDWEISSDKDIEAVEGWLSGLDEKDRTIVRMSIVGQISVAQKARLDGVLEHHTDLLAAIERLESHSDLVVIPDEADLEHFGLSGFADDALTELRTLAENGDSALAARDALALLYRLVGSSLMKLHRVKLRNYRGVIESDVSFSQNGVTIIEGPNEVGKTAISEGLQLAIDYPDSARHAKVKAVQPVGRDEGPEVEISSVDRRV